MKKGFSLVEIMLVLSIIGVLMALMIPVLDRSKPDETTLKYRKAFFAIEQGVRTILNDVKLYESGDLRYATGTPDSGEVTNSEGYINDTAGGTSKSGRRLCYNLANTLNTIGTVRCPGDSGYTPLILGNGTPTGTVPVGSDTAISNPSTDANMTDEKQVNFKLSNGVVVGGLTGEWNVTNDNKTYQKTSFITLCVDVNGIKDKKGNASGPNVGCATKDRANPKRDQFRIRLARDGKVYTDSPTGPNNWYLETLMLVNPGSVTGDKRKWTEQETVELTKETSKDDTDLTSKPCPIGYVWYQTGTSASVGQCVFSGGFSLEKITGQSNK